MKKTIGMGEIMLRHFQTWASIAAIGSFAAISPPRLRPSPYFGNIAGMSYTSLEELGEHDYDSGSGENNGLLYTARAGFIDMGHLRESADRARYVFEVSQEHILNGDRDYSLDMIESAEYHIHLDYPGYWGSLDTSSKQRIARQIAIDIGQYTGHMSTVWHEIVSWYGYSSIGLMSEKPSSFSWEDVYSDALGPKIAADVLRANEPYNSGMTEHIRREIQDLDPQPAETARQATETIHGKWYSGRYPLVHMKKRNFDAGFDDGQITPWRVPGIASGAPEKRCPAPRLDALRRHGFKMRLTLTPHEMERKQVLKAAKVEGDTIEPAVHFPIIISQIRQEAIEHEGPEVEQPTL